MVIHALPTAAQSHQARVAPTRPTASSPDRAEVSGDSAPPGQSSRLTGAAVGALVGAAAGMAAMWVVSPVLTPLIGLGVGALVASGPFKIKGKRLSEYLSPFKVNEGDDEATRKSKNLKNWGVRLTAGAVAGLLAMNFAGPAIMLGSAGAGLVAGWKLGGR